METAGVVTMWFVAVLLDLLAWTGAGCSGRGDGIGTPDWLTRELQNCLTFSHQNWKAQTRHQQ